MSYSVWEKYEEIFPHVADLPENEREVRLRELCADDDELRREILALLKADEKAGQFIESPIALPDSLSQVFREVQTEKLITTAREGSQFGAYRVLGKIGAGGMGAVYLAERADGEFRKKAAIKLVKNGADTDFNLRRFRHERQILAGLEHPNIARLLDGGTTENGSPYLVMEYVEGKTLFDFCNSRELNLRERLDLFRQICQAVEHAHKRGVIHRDIKPGNILVNENGTVKLLDFGIAKILDGDFIGDSIEQTATMMRQMTPEYASPEQIKGEAITPASDVYSLGVVLYELLSGERPYKFTSRAPHEIARVVCEQEVQSLKSKLLNRQTDDSQPAIHDSLEAVVLKSLRKKPAERYASVNDFDRDIGRILDGLPVSTGSDEFQSLKSANEILSAANVNSAGASEKSNSTGDDLAARTIGGIQATTSEARTLGKLKTRTAFTALVCLVFVAGWSFFYFSVWKKQEMPIESGTVAAPPSEERKEIEKPRTTDAVADGLYLAARQQMAARTADGLNRAVELFKQAVERDPDFALAFSGLSDAYNLLGMNKMKEPAEALRLAEEYAVKALTLDPDSVEARISLAMAKFRRTKDAAEAERLFLRANEINPRHATARHWYAVILGETGRYEEAVRQLQIAAEIEPRSAVIQSALALTYLKMNRQDDVIFHAERAIELESRLVNAYAAKSIVLQQRGDYEAARENFRQAHIINGGGATEPFWLIVQAFAHAHARRKSEALATFDRLSKTPVYRKSPENFIPDAAILHHLLGDDDRAFEWLRKIDVKNKTLIDTVKSDARLAKLREDSRFPGLIEKWNKEADSK